MDSKRDKALSRLTPIEAIRAFLAGEFGIGDETAIVAAIRRDPRVTLTEDEVLEVLGDALEEGVDAETCLARLMAFG
ncbi:MAG TPA: hypothetical protein VF170_10770 [Planctomycetaceae bacterium]